MLPRRPTAAALSLALAACCGCGAIGPTLAPDSPRPGGGWLEAARRQCRQAIEGIRADIAVLDSEDDGLDGFGPVAAREMRSMRAELDR